MKYINCFGIYYLLFLVLLTACKKEDLSLGDDDIKGTVKLIDIYREELSDKSGVVVNLTGYNVDMQTITDEDGTFYFNNVPFGVYQVEVEKENFIQEETGFSISHYEKSGRYTGALLHMNEVPDFEVSVDSVVFIQENEYYKIYLKIVEDYSNLEIFDLLCYASDSPDVSYLNYKDNFLVYVWTYFGLDYYSGDFSVEYDLDMSDYSDTIYLRAYPQAYFDGLYPNNDKDYYTAKPGTFGKPSAVYAFTLEDTLSE